MIVIKLTKKHAEMLALVIIASLEEFQEQAKVLDEDMAEEILSFLLELQSALATGGGAD